ncbi:MAG TPA: hypothetical protein VI756_11230 [Blastocatellia bacterium]
MLKGNAPFVITEWEWFRFSLRLLALERSASLFGLNYEFNDRNRTVKCVIYHGELAVCAQGLEDARRFVDEYILGWVHWAESDIKSTLAHLPGLARDFRLDERATFVVVSRTKAGSTVVCTIKGGQAVVDPAAFDKLLGLASRDQ